MAVEWGPDNVRVVGVSPGPIADTEANTFLGWSNHLSIANGLLSTNNFAIPTFCTYIKLAY